MALRAVIFDYGMVLSGPVNTLVRNQLIRATGLTEEQFEPLYWADRHAYDEGKLSGAAYWQKFVADSRLPHSPSELEELNRLDAQMWTTFDPAVIAWQLQLKQHGLRTAILSNMGDTVLESLEREFTWLGNFDVLVWSYQLGIAKPDPAIYLQTLERLGTLPSETLFLDDKLVNIEAAQALGIHAIEFTTIANLRKQLEESGLANSLPLPA